MNLRTYRARVFRWKNADTAVLDVDLGFRVSARIDIQLARIDAPERGEAGDVEALAECQRLAPPGSDVVITTGKDDKYGRWLAEVVTSDERNISDTLLEKELAAPYRAAKR